MWAALAGVCVVALLAASGAPGCTQDLERGEETLPVFADAPVLDTLGRLALDPGPEDEAGPDTACEPGAACTLEAEPCLVAETDCTGAPTCKATGNAPDGKACGSDKVCSSGACVGCQEGGPCTDSASPCASGTFSCATGGSVCVVSGVVQNGTSCGAGKVCADGVCVSCDDGAACTLDEQPCLTGTIGCATGAPMCGNLAPVPSGTECGAGKSCYAGTCVDCVPGGACTPEAQPCTSGVLACGAGGALSCDAIGLQPDGTPCGAGAVCYGGGCYPCQVGQPCAPASAPCNEGSTDCSTGLDTCLDLGTPAADGTACGFESVCQDGSCIACADGSPCDLASDPCKAGVITCATGNPVCAPSGGPAENGKPCGDDKVCNAGKCAGCVEGDPCAVPGKPCSAGGTSCATGSATCLDTGAAAPDGTACGTSHVCKGGVCQTCVGGGPCTPEDPCAVGASSCSSGSLTCVATGPKPGSEGTACGIEGTGTCAAGACACPPGQVFFLGDCNTCPDFTGTTIYVNAAADVGLDNACCGRSDLVGQLGGPCRTVTHAMKVVPNEPAWTILVTGDAFGNASPTETYPIHLGKGVILSSSGVCYPGSAGKNIVHVDSDGTTVSIYGGTFGTTCSGISSNAADAIYVGASPVEGEVPKLEMVSGKLVKTEVGVRVVKASANVSYLELVDVGTGFHVDGGTFASTYSTIVKIKDYGLWCRSTTLFEAMSDAQITGLSVSNSPKSAVYAGHNCNLQIWSSTIGGDPAQTGCPGTKQGVGIWLEGSVSAEIGGVIVRCAYSDGVAVRAVPDALGDPGVPQLTLSDSSLFGNGCAGLFAEVGTVAAWGNTIRDNHYGVLARGTAPGDGASVALTGVSPAAGTSRNSFYCNTKSVNGACCTLAACPNGFDVWNNTGGTIDATYNTWQESPVVKYSCGQDLTGCLCSGVSADKCQATPPDGTSVVSSPYGSGDPKTPTTNNALPADPFVCE